MTTIISGFVKKTVNSDDPSAYHLYYGDEVGTPGTVLTFFPWEHARRGRRGVGEASLTQFSIPPGSLPFWRECLERAGAPVVGPVPYSARSVWCSRIRMA